MGGLAEEHFAGFHQGFGERGVRVNRQREVCRVGAHLYRQDAFGNQLAGAAADDADPEDALGRGSVVSIDAWSVRTA